MHAPSTCPEATTKAHGISQDGGLAEFVRVESSRLFAMPSGTDPASVGLVEPLAVVVHGINRLTLHSGQRAVVVGAGSIGLLAAAVLKDRGVDVDIVARHSHQFAAAEQLNITAVEKAGKNYDCSFDAVCTQESFDQCVSATRPRGSLLEFGMVWSPVALSNNFMMKEINIIPSIYYSHDNEHDDFAEAIDVLHRNPNITHAIVTHRFALEDAEHAFTVAADRKSGAIKVHMFTTL
jgi:threonine dehydrogenase-like Zn-dependent dehydrogenase